LHLVDWARRVDALVVEDDYDGEYRYEDQSLQSLQGLLEPIDITTPGLPVSVGQRLFLWPTRAHEVTRLMVTTRNSSSSTVRLSVPRARP
jgi:hypothetical protein